MGIPKHIEFDDVKYTLHGRYYVAPPSARKEHCNLHRAIWSKAHGTIPKKHHIHHIDGDCYNNDLSNLACLSEFKHLSDHAKSSGWVGSPANISQIKNIAGPLAAEWHGSPEGIAWHSEHGKDSWIGREKVKATCIHCMSEYETPFPTRSLYCSAHCRSLHRSVKKRKLRHDNQ